MEQARSIEQATENPLDRDGLCILSLDGGGVRGLSTLHIIKALMHKVNTEREKHGQPSVKPCQIFDLIGGTSTGGIIAIMLGRLEMDIDDCINTYRIMSQTIFKKKSRLPLSWQGNLKGRFDSAVFEECIRKILESHGLPDAEPFNDGKERCKIAVSATDFETASTVLLRSYESSEALNNSVPFTICQAVRATSAASTFFEPVTIEPFGRRFVDGGLGANNPVEQLWNEAQNIWCQDEEVELSKILKCFISIGTGDPGLKPINEGPWKFLSETLVKITTDSEKSAELFIDRHRLLYERKRYFRFNVQQGLQGIGLAEYREAARIDAATTKYMNAQETRSATRECALNLKQKHLNPDFSPESIIQWNSNCKLAVHGQKPITFIPFHRNDTLVHRDRAFKALDRAFSQPSPNQSLAIWGLGGCGKTQIGLEYAYRRQRKTFCSIFWVHADSEARFRKDYSDIGKLAGLPPDLKGDDLLRAVQQWVEQQTNWLLILDNADDLRIFKTAYSAPQTLNNADDLRIFKTAYSAPQTGQKRHSPELHQYVPKSQTGTVMWISRDKGILGNLVKLNRGIEVGVMTIEESRQLFQQLSGQDDEELSLQDEKLKELLELLEMLPLAIAQAAMYIRKTKVSIRQYLSFFAESESRQSSLLSQEFQDVYRSEVPNSVMHTWLISMKQLADESPYGNNILNVIAFFDNQEIPFELVRLAAGLDCTPDGVLMATGRLMEYSFLQIKGCDKDLQVYEQHRLVNLAVRLGLSEIETRDFSGMALAVMLQVFPDGSHGTWKACELYLPHALKAVSWQGAGENLYQTSQLLKRIANFYSEQGRSNEAEEVQLKVLQIHKKRLGEKEDLDMMVAMLSLATTWFNQGRFEEAEQAQMRVLKMVEKAFGKEDPWRIVVKANLGKTWYAQHRFKEAEEAHLEVLEWEKKLHGEEHPNSIICMSSLAYTWWRQGKLVAAESLLSRILDLQTELLGKRHPDTVRTMANLASWWCELGHLEKAESLQKTVLELQKESQGEKHPHTIMTMANLASTWTEQGRWEEAERLQIEVLEVRKEVLRENHPDTIAAMEHLATTWNEQGRWEEAERLQIEVLEVRKEVLRENHPDTIIAMVRLASIWLSQGRLDQAEKQGLEALELQTLVLGEKHPHTIIAKANLAITLFKQNRITEAEKYQTEVLDLKKEVLGDKHQHTIIAMESLATTRWVQGRLDEVRELQEDVVRLRKEVFGEEHPDTTAAVRTLRLIQPKSSDASTENQGRRKAWKRKLMKWKR